MWDDETSRFFIKEKSRIQQMNVEKFYSEDKFGLLVDLHTLARQGGTRLVESRDCIQLVIKWDVKGSNNLECQVYVIANAQLNILNIKLHSVLY